MGWETTRVRVNPDPLITGVFTLRRGVSEQVARQIHAVGLVFRRGRVENGHVCCLTRDEK